MQANVPDLAHAPRPTNLPHTPRLGFMAACAVLAAALLGSHWVQDTSIAMLYAGVVALAVGAFVASAWRASWFLPWRALGSAFLAFALVQLLNVAVQWTGANLLHQAPTGGNPLASSVWGTLVVQLLETGVAVGAIVAVTLACGLNLKSIYLGRGKPGRWLLVAVAVFIAMYAVTCLLPLHRLFPVNAALPLTTKLALTPALVVLALSNGVQEELLFRGLFLRKYDAWLGRGAANVLQALVFTLAHAGITYAATLLLFAVAFIFPLGLVAGRLMQKTDSLWAPAVLHAAFDIPIYMAFLTAVS